MRGKVVGLLAVTLLRSLILQLASHFFQIATLYVRLGELLPQTIHLIRHRLQSHFQGGDFPRALVLCASFARNPVGHAAAMGASFPGLVKLGPMLMGPMSWTANDARRTLWAAGLARALAALGDDVVAERLRLIASEDVSAQLQALRIPTLVVHFASDTVIGPQARAHLESACRNPRVMRLEGPHFAIATRPLECAAAITAGLA